MAASQKIGSQSPVLNSRFKANAREENQLGQSMPVSVKQLIDYSRKVNNNSQKPLEFAKPESV